MSINACAFTISNTPGTGGAFTVSAADTGAVRVPRSVDDAQVCRLFIREGTAWEIRSGAIYTHSGTSMSRGTLVDSSTGSAISFTSAAIVDVIGWDADTADRSLLGSPNINQVITSQKLICSAHKTTNGASSTGAATVANKIYFEPFFLVAAATADGLGARVGTGVASTSIRLGIYECGSNGHPGALLRETSALSAATSGVDVIGSITAVELRPGWYYTAVATEGAPALGRIDGDGTVSHILGQDSGNLMVSNQGIRADHTFGALPDPAPTTSLTIVSTLSLTTVFIRVAA